MGNTCQLVSSLPATPETTICVLQQQVTAGSADNRMLLYVCIGALHRLIAEIDDDDGRALWKSRQALLAADLSCTASGCWHVFAETCVIAWLLLTD